MESVPLRVRYVRAASARSSGSRDSSSDCAQGPDTSACCGVTCAKNVAGVIVVKLGERPKGADAADVRRVRAPGPPVAAGQAD